MQEGTEQEASSGTLTAGTLRAVSNGAMRNLCTRDANVGNLGAPVSGKTGVSVGEVLLRFVREPAKYLLARWNWKSALLSSLFRAAIFFFTNLAAGLPAAMAAMSTELVFRGITSGFYGALTEGFSDAEPAWAAALAATVVLPLTGHSMELAVHWLRGTRNLAPSITASVVFTALSTLFNLYAMKRGALIVGAGRGSLAEDLRRMPRLVLDFILLVPRWMRRGGYYPRLEKPTAAGAARGSFLGREEGGL
jgi:hypothetical protein